MSERVEAQGLRNLAGAIYICDPVCEEEESSGLNAAWRTGPA
jgi:hypothetical protein